LTFATHLTANVNPLHEIRNELMSKPRIAVIGLGATGSAALYQLARRGFPAIGIEQFAPGHDRGSSHGPTRVIRLAHFENASYVPLLRRGLTLWRELERTANRKFVHVTGIVEMGPANGPLVQGTLAASRSHNLPHEVLDAAALLRCYPQFQLPSDFVAVTQPDGGIIEAASVIEANLRIAADAGALVRVKEKVLAIEPKATGAIVKTDRDAIEADGAIVAAGPWLGSLLPELDLPLRVTRQVVGWFEPHDAAHFAADRFPVFLLESEYGIHYGFPARDHLGVKVSKHHHLSEVVDPDTCNRRVTAADEGAIRTALAKYLPRANGRLLDAQTCLYTMTPDDTFIVDHLPGYPQVVIASPCCGHGFKFSPVIGETVADLVTQGTTQNDISQFRLQRLASSEPTGAQDGLRRLQ
jgi:sarcosine oxidase